MKKFLFALAFAGLATAAFAQDEALEEKYSVQTNSFWSNWFVSANYQFSTNYGSQEGLKNYDFDKNPFKDFRSNHGFSVAVGKWFTPGLGLRVKGSLFKSKSVVSEDKDINDFDAWRAEGDVLFNLTNMVMGYKEDRIYNLIPYVGAGWAHSMSYGDDAKTFNVGILNTFAINKRVAVNFELGAMFADADFDGVSVPGQGDNWFGCQDIQFAAELGLTVNLGKTLGWTKSPDLDAIRAKHDGELAALNGQLSDAQAANRRLQDELAKKPKEVVKEVVKEVGLSSPLSVFFNLSSSKIAGTRELVNLEALANAVKEKGGKITVTGYADSKTGSAKINERLGQKRAEAVAAKLKSYGISDDQITIVNGGGVDDIKPFSYNRRAVVEVK